MFLAMFVVRSYRCGIFLMAVVMGLLQSGRSTAQSTLNDAGVSSSEQVKSDRWIGLSPFLWEISDTKSYTKVSAGYDRGYYLKSRPNLMLGYTLAASVHHNRSLAIAPQKLWTGHFLVEGRVRTSLGSGRDGLFLEGGINFFLDDSLTFKLKSLDFNLGGYAALGFQKTLADRILLMPALQYRHNDFMTRENGLFLRLGLGYKLQPKL
ncbi:MAG: hypothetical protein ACO3CL_04930 [Bacteroidia bacterium]|jgi:hypothetical protein